MTRTLILHVGTEKTGSTSLQRILHRNRRTLQNHGILVPESFGKFNHDLLVTALLDDDVFDNIKLRILADRKWSIEQLRQHTRTSFEKDLNRFPATKKIIFTSELIHSRMFRDVSIARIEEYFSGIVDEVKVVVFLRRQDRLAISRFSTVLKDGYTGFDDTFANLSPRSYVNTPIEKIPDDLQHYYNYEHLLRILSNQFGKSSMVPIVYREDRCDVATEFFQATGMPREIINEKDIQITLNGALSLEAQKLICSVNRIEDVRDETNNPRRNIQKLYARIAREHPGKKRVYARDKTRQFYEKFESSNEWVRRNFFPDSNSLFDNDFTCYPEKVDRDEFEPEVLEASNDYYNDLVKSGKKSLMSKAKKEVIKFFSIGARK